MQKEGGEAVSDSDFPYALMFGLIIGSIILGGFIGCEAQRDVQQREAVAAGHAEWVADKSGKPQFKWKECK
jgi:hypothetical protein